MGSSPKNKVITTSGFASAVDLFAADERLVAVATNLVSSSTCVSLCLWTHQFRR